MKEKSGNEQMCTKKEINDEKKQLKVECPTVYTWKNNIGWQLNVEWKLSSNNINHDSWIYEEIPINLIQSKYTRN